MATTHTIRTDWTADRDEVFFRIVQSLYPPAWLSAASVLLASYDDDDGDLGADLPVVSAPAGLRRSVPAQLRQWLSGEQSSPL